MHLKDDYKVACLCVYLYCILCSVLVSRVQFFVTYESKHKNNNDVRLNHDVIVRNFILDVANNFLRWRVKIRKESKVVFICRTSRRGTHSRLEWKPAGAYEYVHRSQSSRADVSASISGSFTLPGGVYLERLSRLLGTSCPKGIDRPKRRRSWHVPKSQEPKLPPVTYKGTNPHPLCHHGRPASQIPWLLRRWGVLISSDSAIHGFPCH